MATATHHSFSCFAWIAVIALLLSGCSSPQERYERDLQQAVELRIQGDTDAALQRLEKLATKNPDDVRVLLEMARAYADQGDAATAAFFLAEVAKQNPEDTELLIEAYQAQRAAGDTERATELILKMEESAPELLGPDEWQVIGSIRAEQNRVRSALEAYLRSARLNDGQTDSETALEIGRLFIQVENYPQAELWLRRAVTDEITELPARFALMEVYFNQSAWGQAEQEMEALDERFPGAIEGSQWAEARAELDRWKTARAEAARIATEQIASIQLPTAEAATEDTAGATETDTTATTTAAATAEPSESAATPSHPTSIKLAGLDEHATIEATSDPAESVETELALDPAIAIEPTDPMDGLSVTFDGAGEDSIVFETDPTTTLSTRPVELPLLERAQQAAAEGNTAESIRLYWRALGETPDDPTIWQRLADVYLIEGQLRNAETTILEAIRLAPQSTGLTLQHLRIQQRLLDPRSFVRAVEQAAERFPRSADIALSLARAYDRVLNDSVAAQRQYRRFIDLDPNHPFRDEAEAALSRLF